MDGWIQELPNFVCVWHFISNETKALGICLRRGHNNKKAEYIPIVPACGDDDMRGVREKKEILFFSAMQCVTHTH